MRIINKKYLLVILLVGIILTGFIVFMPKENVKLDNVILKQEVNSKTFAMYKEEGESYVPVEGTKFPEGYVLNITESKCIDNNGNELSGVLSYENGNVTITSGNTTYCYLYFDKARTYILMAKDGIIKEPDIKLTNILGEEGNFEKDTDFDQYKTPLGSGTHCIVDTNIYKYGNKSCKISSISSHIEQFIGSSNNYEINNTHTYYARVEYYFKLDNSYELSGESIEFFWPAIIPPALGVLPITESEKWQVASVINNRSTFDNTKDMFRIDFNYSYYIDNYAEIRFDGAMLIDLTESYGENYPSLDELNQLYYFDNSIEIKKVVDKNGIFELNNEIPKIECNNNVSQEIGNSKVTIESKGDYTVCIIRE